jgi:hypothetical protein
VAWPLASKLTDVQKNDNGSLLGTARAAKPLSRPHERGQQVRRIAGKEAVVRT